MADMHAEVDKALSSEKPKLHAHRVEYERSDNGGFHAHVHMHHKAAPHPHHHTQHHIVPNVEAMKAHMEEHMGDQPEVQTAQEPDGDEAAAGADPAAAGAGAGAAAPPEAGM